MIRRLLTGAAVLSLLLLVAAAVLWVRSYHTADLIRRGWSSGHLLLVSTRGHAILHEQIVPNDKCGWEVWSLPVKRFDERCIRQASVWSVAGVSFERHDGAGEFAAWHERTVVIPFWIASVAFLALPAAKARSILRRRLLAARAGLCASCGHDLRASKDRCPECGNAINSNAGETNA